IDGQEPILLHRLADLECSSGESLTRSHPEHSALVVPLGADPSIGALFLLRNPRRHRRAFAPEMISRAQTFGDLAALTFRKLQLLGGSARRHGATQHGSQTRAHT